MPRVAETESYRNAKTTFPGWDGRRTISLFERGKSEVGGCESTNAIRNSGSGMLLRHSERTTRQPQLKLFGVRLTRNADSHKWLKRASGCYSGHAVGLMAFGTTINSSNVRERHWSEFYAPNIAATRAISSAGVKRLLNKRDLRRGNAVEREHFVGVAGHI